MSPVYTVAAIALLLLLIYANVDVDSPPVDPRKKILKRHVWRMILRAEGRERPYPYTDTEEQDEPNNQPEPQAKWSDRR